MVEEITAPLLDELYPNIEKTYGLPKPKNDLPPNEAR
jgi:hypothetical protein